MIRPATVIWSLIITLIVCIVACGEPSPGSHRDDKLREIFDPNAEYDVFIDAIGPSGFSARTETGEVFTDEASYEQAAPALLANAAQAGKDVRFVYGSQAQDANDVSPNAVTPQWTEAFEGFGYYVTISSPSYKSVSGCVSQMAYTANLRIHRFQRGVDSYGTQLRDFHLSGYSERNTGRICIGLVETETGWPNWCNCPGKNIREAYGNMRQGIVAGLQDSGMNYSQASLFATAILPIAALCLAPAGL